MTTGSLLQFFRRNARVIIDGCGHDKLRKPMNRCHVQKWYGSATALYGPIHNDCLDICGKESPAVLETLIHALFPFMSKSDGLLVVEMIQALIDFARDIKASAERGGEEGLSDDELAFYDALAQNESAVEVMGNEQLRVIAHELLESMKANATVDWRKKESARAKMRILVRRVLKKCARPLNLLCCAWTAPVTLLEQRNAKAGARRGV